MTTKSVISLFTSLEQVLVLLVAKWVGSRLDSLSKPLVGELVRKPVKLVLLVVKSELLAKPVFIGEQVDILEVSLLAGEVVQLTVDTGTFGDPWLEEFSDGVLTSFNLLSESVVDGEIFAVASPVTGVGVVSFPISADGVDSLSRGTLPAGIFGFGLYLTLMTYR